MDYSSTRPLKAAPGGDKFPNQVKWQGTPVDMNYGTIPTDKKAIEENLKVAGQEAKDRFGLNEMGLPEEAKAPTDKPLAELKNAIHK